MDKMEDYKPVFISFRLSAAANKELTLACKSSGRKKTQEARLRLEHHLKKYEAIGNVDCVKRFDVGSKELVS